MSPAFLLLLALGLGLAGWLAARARAWSFRRAAPGTKPKGPTPDDPDSLTDREERVLSLVADGRTNGEIATLLGVSESTVKFHLRNLYAKLGVTNRAGAASRFHRRG